jgi:hypothetical protein
VSCQHAPFRHVPFLAWRRGFLSATRGGMVTNVPVRPLCWQEKLTKRRCRCYDVPVVAKRESSKTQPLSSLGTCPLRCNNIETVQVFLTLWEFAPFLIPKVHYHVHKSHWSPSRDRWIQSTSPHAIYLGSISLSLHLRLGPSSCVIRLGFPNNIYMHFSSQPLVLLAPPVSSRSCKITWMFDSDINFKVLWNYLYSAKRIEMNLGLVPYDIVTDMVFATQRLPKYALHQMWALLVNG